MEDNLIIHGDNLHALKALLPRYAGKVKCIYIDPPYNTGNENWVYNDNVNSPMMQAWLEKHSPVDLEDLERHDKWLCMMWPRLHLLQELLSDDGVIFISIDDNEVHRLRMLMDEVFGEENFIESFTWRSRLGRGATAKNTATLHEYIVVYAKRMDSVKLKADKRIRKAESRERLRQWGQGDRREDRPTMYYPIHSDEFGEIYPIRADGTDGRWRVSQATMQDLIESNLIVFEKQPDGRIEAYRIMPAGTETYTAYPSMLDSEVVKTTAHGSIELKNIMGPNKFSYPKPSLLIKELVFLCTQEEDIVLDSFAGSQAPLPMLSSHSTKRMAGTGSLSSLNVRTMQIRSLPNASDVSAMALKMLQMRLSEMGSAAPSPIAPSANRLTRKVCSPAKISLPTKP